MREHKLGKTVLTIEPLGFTDLAKFTVKIKAIFSSVGEKGISANEVESPDGMIAMFEAGMEHAPDLLEMATGLHRDDIAKLPLGPAVALLRAVIEVNIDSQESLLKNLRALGEMLGLLNPAEQDTTTDGE